MPKEKNPKHKLSVMGVEGHAELVWDIHDWDSVVTAKKMFDELLAKGFQAFEVEREDSDDPHNARKGGKLKKFDPAAGEIIMVPKIAGG